MRKLHMRRKATNKSKPILQRTKTKKLTRFSPYVIGVLILIFGFATYIRLKPQPIGINEVAVNPVTEPAVCGQIVKFLVNNQCNNSANFKTAQINCSTSDTIITINSQKCTSVANLFNKAYAKCSQLCTTPSPTPVSSPYYSPKPSYTPYPTPTSTTRPTPTPTPKP